jgi:hypothetical protein
VNPSDAVTCANRRSGDVTPDKSRYRTSGNWSNIAPRHLSGKRVNQDSDARCYLAAPASSRRTLPSALMN